MSSTSTLHLKLKYLRLKIAALIIRFVVRIAGALQRILSGPADWEEAYGRVSREYSIESSKTEGKRIKVSLVC